MVSVVLVVWMSLSSLSLASLSLSSVCAPPPVVRHGPAPHATYHYRFYGAWTTYEQQCVRRSLDQWETALHDTLDVRFVPVTDAHPLPTVVLAKTRLPSPVGGAVVGVVMTPDGYLQRGSLLFTDDAQRLSSCDGFQKTTLHEVGHLLGLGHVDAAQASIMRPSMDGADDRGQGLPSSPTVCDVAQAVRSMTD